MNNELDGEHWNKVQFECTIDWSESSIITMNKVQSEGQEGDSKLKHFLQKQLHGITLNVMNCE